MPTPIGHTLSGLFLMAFWFRSGKKSIWLIIAVLFFAFLPDMDLFYGLMVAGNANAYHHQASHSILFVCLAGWLGGRIGARWGQFTGLFIAAGLIHLGLDILAKDTSSPYGAPLFWPFWKGYLISPVQIFSDVHRTGESGLFFASLFNWHNFQTVLIEILVFVPFVFWLVWTRRKQIYELKGTA